MHKRYTKIFSKGFKLWLPLSLIFLVALFLSRSLFGRGLIKGTDILIHVTWLTLCSRNDWWFQLWVPSPSFGQPLLFSLQFNVFLFSISKIMLNNALLAMKIYVFLSIFLAGISMFFLSRHYTANYQANLLSAFVYMASQYFFSQLFEGHIDGLVFNYAMAPFLFLFFDRALQKNQLRDNIIVGVILALFVVTGYPISIYIMLPSVFCFLIFKTVGKGKREYIKFAKILLVSIGVFLCLLAYQILPFLGGARPIYLGATYTIEEAYFWSNKNLWDALTVKATELGFIKDMEYSLPAFLQVIVTCWIPVFAFAVVLFRRDRTTLFFSLSAIFCSFLAKGPNPPLGEIYIWLWDNIPGFSAIRVGSRWSMITMISYSLLVGISYSEFSLRFKQLAEKQFLTVKPLHPWKKIIPYLCKYGHNAIIGIILMAIILNSWAGFAHSIGTYDLPEAYIKPYEQISRQPGDFNVLTLPYAQAYISTSWSGIARDPSYYSPVIHGKSVITGQGGTTFSRDFLSFIGSLIHDNGTNNFAKILGTFNTKYFIIQSDTSDHERIFFSKQKNLKILYQFENVTVMKNDFWIPHIFPVSKYAIVVGGREAFTALTTIDNFDLSNWNLLFADQIVDQLGVDQLLQLLNEAHLLIFANSEPLDLAILTLEDAIRIRATDYAYPSTNAHKYWINEDRWTSMGMSVQNRYLLSTSAILSLSMPINVEDNGQYDVWIRLLHGPSRGNLSVTIDGIELGSIVPYARHYSGLKWIKIGSAQLEQGKHDLTLTNKNSTIEWAPGYSNNIDEILLVKPQHLESAINQTTKLLQQSPARIINIIEGEQMFKWATTPHFTDWWTTRRPFNASGGWVASTTNETTWIPLKYPILKDGRYSVALRTTVGPDQGTLQIVIDDTPEYLLNTSSQEPTFRWITLAPITLQSGNHTFDLYGEGRVEIDQIVIYSLNQGEDKITLDDVFRTQKPQATISYEMINPTKYTVHVKTSTPFFLVFSEAYHNLWKAYVDGEEIQSIPTYSFINTFQISKTGEYNIVIEFIGQRYVVYGGIISIISITLTIIYLTFGTKINQFIVRKLKLKQKKGNEK